MAIRSRAPASLAVAIAAHALAIAWMVLRTPPGPVGPGAVAPPMEIEIAVEAPAPAPAPLELPSPTPEPQAIATRAAPRATQPGPASTAARDDAPSAPVASADPGGSATWTFSPTTRPTTTDTEAAADGALARATVTGIAAVLEEASKKAADRQRKPMVFTPRDMELGLVPGSQYVPIARDRVRSSVTPANGHALLEFWTDSRGIVARVRVLDASSDRQAWDDVASALVEDARGSFPLKIPSNSDGLIVTIDVTSVLKRLSGAAASQGSLARAFGAITNPMDAVVDSKAAPQRVVIAKVVGVQAF
ncbi:MAG TPA: hypothetical protein VIF09_25070 [Polyangiaceae bacterium]